MKTSMRVIAAMLAAGLVFMSCGKTEEKKEAAPPQQQTPSTTPTPSAQTPTPGQQPSAPPPTGQIAATPAAEGKLVALDIKLPRPMFVGTPTNIAVPNLEKPLGKPRPPFLVPEGTSNIALKKPVSGSDELPTIGELSMVTDGDKEAAEGSFVELGPKVQYVTIDLKARFTIYAMLVWHFHKQAVVYHDVIIQVADDPDFVSNVATVFNNDIDNTAGRGIGKDMAYVETSEGKLIDSKGVQGRYVRLYSRGNTANDFNHYTEVEVYGKPVK